MATDRGRTPLTRVEITPGSVILVIGAIALAVLAAETLVAARRILSWVVACAVAAALIELAVNWLDRWVQRTIALVIVLISVAAIAAGLVFGVLNDLDAEVREIQSDAPAAARQLQYSERFGKLATEVHLEERVEAAVEQLSSPSSGLAGQAVSSVGTYTICIVLTILFLSWGPKLSRSLLMHLSPQRRALMERVAKRGFSRSRSYVAQAMLQAATVGLIGWTACTIADVPAPIPLALSLCALSLIPYLGIAVGALPILLLTYGLNSTAWGVKLTILFAGLQLISSIFVQPYIVKRSGLYVGPAITTVAALLGFELYGIGGALYGTAVVVFALAAIDSFAVEQGIIEPQELPGLQVEDANRDAQR